METTVPARCGVNTDNWRLVSQDASSLRQVRVMIPSRCDIVLDFAGDGEPPPLAIGQIMTVSLERITFSIFAKYVRYR